MWPVPSEVDRPKRKEKSIQRENNLLYSFQKLIRILEALLHTGPATTPHDLLSTNSLQNQRINLVAFDVSVDSPDKQG
jgi:hypothetical protein